MLQPVLLTYRVPAKHAAKLRVLAVRMGIRVRAVEKWEYIQPVGSFTHFPQSVFSRFLQELRAARLVFPLKCVLTESNRGWNSLELHEQLCEERDAIARGASAHDPEGGGIA